MKHWKGRAEQLRDEVRALGNDYHGSSIAVLEA